MIVHELTKAAQSLLIKLFFCCELRDHIAQQLKYFRMSTSTVAATEARGQQIAKSRAVRCERTAFSYWKAVLDAKKSRALEISYRTRMMHFQILFRTRKKRRGFNKDYVEDRQCRNCGLFGHLEFHPFCPLNVTTASCTKEYPKEPRRRHHGQKKKEPKWVYLADEKNNFLVPSGFELYSRA
jgi:hypothetical protein